MTRPPPVRVTANDTAAAAVPPGRAAGAASGRPRRPPAHAWAAWVIAGVLAGALAAGLLASPSWAHAAALLVVGTIAAGALWRLRAREAALAAVTGRQRELGAIVESVQHLLFRTDAEGCLTFVNARWGEATGAGEAEAIGRPLAHWVAPESAAAARALFDGREGLRSTVILMGPADRQRRFEVSVLPLKAGRRVAGYAGSAVDVTERELVRLRLQSQLDFIGQLLEVMPLPVSMLDADGRYLSVNQAWEEFTGRRRGEVAGRRARDDLPPDEAAVHDARDRELLRMGGSVRYEVSLAHRDGSRRDVAVSKAAVPGPDGRPAGVLVAFMDVSEFRDAERAVREARDIAEEASRAKSEFIANISHELRTPLQSIIGFSELGHLRSGDARLGAMFGDIHAAGERMLALVNDLLDVSKIESAVGTFHLERIDVRTLVREVLHELQPLLAERRLHVDLDLCEAPLVAKVDPLRYQQVLRNLLANAIRFSPPGQSIEVAGDIDAENQVHVCVRDHGPGIPPGELEAIFQAFVQSSKTKDGSGGTGLGLTISRKIVEAHGGRIHAENARGGGSAFHVRVPGRTGDTVTMN